jgi:phage terminase large subunit-like protein
VVSEPRFQVVPAGSVSSRGGRAVELARSAGLELDEAQQQILHGGLGVRADGSWSAFEVAIVEPRQNGKSSTLQARMMLGLELGEQIAYTCHRIDASQEVFRGLVALVEESPELGPLLQRVIYSNGKESIWLENGARCVFGTRSSRTGRGFSLDLWIADEAHILAVDSHTALMPATSARGHPPQVWYAGTAVDERTNEHGLVLARLRERAIAGEGRSLAYFEWSLALHDEEGVELRPDEVLPEMVDDEQLWEQANPALGVRITAEHVRAEREAMDHRGWLVERLGIGDWPDTSETAGAPLTGEQWAALQDADSKQTGELVLCFDIGPDRRTALVACGRRGIDGLLHVELLDARPGSGWLAERLEYLEARYDVREIIADDYPGNRAMMKALSAAGLRVRGLSGAEHVAACSRLLDLVAEKAFHHIGQLEMLQALRGAKTKAVGDAWCWSRKASSGDAAVVIAMTLALAVGSEIPADAEELAID